MKPHFKDNINGFQNCGARGSGGKNISNLANEWGKFPGKKKKPKNNLLCVML